MCALLFHMAGIQNDDSVCTDDRGKSVGNHNYCPVLCEFYKGFLDQRLVLGIGKSRCLVQHYDRRILQNCTCQCHTLLLASGQVCAFGADHGINAVRQLFNNVIALCGGEGFQYFFREASGLDARTFSRIDALNRCVFWNTKAT